MYYNYVLYRLCNLRCISQYARKGSEYTKLLCHSTSITWVVLNGNLWTGVHMLIAMWPVDGPGATL